MKDQLSEQKHIWETEVKIWRAINQYHKGKDLPSQLKNWVCRLVRLYGGAEDVEKAEKLINNRAPTPEIAQAVKEALGIVWKRERDLAEKENRRPRLKLLRKRDEERKKKAENPSSDTSRNQKTIKKTIHEIIKTVDEERKWPSKLTMGKLVSSVFCLQDSLGEKYYENLISKGQIVNFLLEQARKSEKKHVELSYFFRRRASLRGIIKDLVKYAVDSKNGQEEEIAEKLFIEAKKSLKKVVGELANLLENQEVHRINDLKDQKKIGPSVSKYVRARKNVAVGLRTLN